jgi:hypothetical protein
MSVSRHEGLLTLSVVIENEINVLSDLDGLSSTPLFQMEQNNVDVAFRFLARKCQADAA